MAQGQGRFGIVKITKWFRKNSKTKLYEFNHLEDGFAPGSKPVPKFKSQYGWKSSEWKKEYAILRHYGSRIPKVCKYPVMIFKPTHKDKTTGE